MAIAHDADSNANSGASTVASLTWSHTCTGSNGLLIVGLGYSGAAITMTVTHAGNNPTGSTQRIQDGSGVYQTQIFWWANPTTGAQNIIATPSILGSLYGGGCSFTGVDQTVPVIYPNDYKTTIGNIFGTVSLTQNTSTTNEALFLLLGMANATSTLAAVSPAIESFNQGDTTAARRTEGEYLLGTSKVAYTLSQTISGSSNRNYSQQIIGINPVGGVLVGATNLNNYQFAHAGDGMSVTEGIR